MPCTREPGAEPK
uniref:Uncharacterized protein n=1 Tax=Arundo donax TaxID=35708 RepID=A0A0A9A5S3_ARUDO